MPWITTEDGWTHFVTRTQVKVNKAKKAGLPKREQTRIYLHDQKLRLMKTKANRIEALRSSLENEEAKLVRIEAQAENLSHPCVPCFRYLRMRNRTSDVTIFVHRSNRHYPVVTIRRHTDGESKRWHYEWIFIHNLRPDMDDNWSQCTSRTMKSAIKEVSNMLVASNYVRR